MSSFEGGKRGTFAKKKRKVNKQTNTFDTFVLHRKRKIKWTLENRRMNNNSNLK